MCHSLPLCLWQARGAPGFKLRVFIRVQFLEVRFSYWCDSLILGTVGFSSFGSCFHLNFVVAQLVFSV